MIHRPSSVVLGFLLAVGFAGCDFAGAPAPTNKAAGAGGESGAGGSGGSQPVPDAAVSSTGGMGGATPQPDAAWAAPDAAASSPDLATAADKPPADVPPPDAAAAYPAGPFGYKVGSVIANVSLTDRTGKAVTMGELRSRPGVRVILWSSGAEWCPACKGEVRKLKMLQTQKAADGLLIVESLHESFDRKPADQNTLNRWDQMFSVNYLLTFEKSPPYEPRVNNPVVWAIDARSMKVLSRESHAEGDVVAAVNAALAATR